MRKIILLLGLIIAMTLIWSYTVRDHTSSVAVTGIVEANVDCVEISFSNRRKFDCSLEGKKKISFSEKSWHGGDITLTIKKQKYVKRTPLTYASSHHAKQCNVDISDIDNILVDCRDQYFVERLFN